MRDYPPGIWDSKPGDRFAMDADLTVYWPAVRACWEETTTPSSGISPRICKDRHDEPTKENA